MGRKSIDKERKPITDKAKSWIRELLPLLQGQSLDKLTLNELCTLMGKSKSTIYTYFETKEEIYQTAVRLILEGLEPILSSKVEEGDNMEQVYRSMLLQISEGIEGLSINFLEQIQINFPDIWLIIESFTTDLLGKFERVYEIGMCSGEFKRFNISLLMAMDNHFVMSIMTNSTQFSDQGLSLNDLVSEYLELRIRALKAV
ncbi:MAG: TetR/AcrR family transcriptional regulator [Bacteroidota bacterium]